MPKPTNRKNAAKPEKKQESSVRKARIDAPHPMGDAEVKPAAPKRAASKRIEAVPALADAVLAMHEPVAESAAAGAAPAPIDDSPARRALENFPAALDYSPEAEAAAEQVQRQAAQLAEHLRLRQKEIDHREALVNARIAELEADARTARMWLSEKESDLRAKELVIAEREKELIKRQEQFAAEERLARRNEKEVKDEAPSNADEEKIAESVASAQNELRDLSAQWASHRDSLQAQVRDQDAALARLRVDLQSKFENDLRDRETVLKREYEAELRAREAAWHDEKDSKFAKQSAKERERIAELEEAERQLADAQAETRALKEKLAEREGRLLAEEKASQERLAAERAQVEAELEKKREALQRRADHVEQCRAALKQLRSELQTMHRETLEIRLATEELWAELSGEAPPAALTRSLGRIRSRLADQYRASNAELLERKKELEEIRDQLADQYEKVIERRHQFERWTADRQEQTDMELTRLVARERELREQEQALEERSQRWELERLEYEQEIRRLRIRTAKEETSAATSA